MIYTESFPILFKPFPHPEAVVSGTDYRFTLLTERLIRLEYDLQGIFEDRPSQVFWRRQQAKPDFTARQANGKVEIETAHLQLVYRLDQGGFKPDTLQILVKEPQVTWQYGDHDSQNLRGTARTLDEAHGAVQLEPGLVSRSGWAVVDDSDRLVFDQHGWLTPRGAADGYQDLYFFGYGHEYASCLRDYARVAGRTPLLPRYALGNWWSRYWEYSHDELLALMGEFKAHQVPLAVCIVDMDWHLTQTGNASSGWTGYTWNRELFPDPQDFIEQLHSLGLKTALNLHPAAGIYPHEAQYRQMAEALDIDPQSEEPVSFDIADPQFTRAYFELLHHPKEAQGIDFWWMDWQQGEGSSMLGLDPLWWLNHLHFYDLGRNGDKRPFVFSRWGGLGNHRYPIGFSGDADVSWESLAFQPYFTATAANVAYGWWSHDIGGHMGGIEDAELYARWVQFGIFSPIMRLHSTKNPYHERRPWGYDAETLRVTRNALQLRHALIPYLYSAAWDFHNKALAPIRPMYLDYPQSEAAYHCPDQYAFGEQLLAAPFISPANPETRMSRQVVWLPPGDWFDFFSGLHYPGDGWHALYGAFDEIPVFAKAGAIVPLGQKTGWGGVDNPESLEVHVFPGADNHYELYEDDGLSAHSLIPFSQTWEAQELRFKIGPVSGGNRHLPSKRAYTLYFHSLQEADLVCRLNGEEIETSLEYDPEAMRLTAGPLVLAPEDTLQVTVQPLSGELIARRNYRRDKSLQLIRSSRLDTWLKLVLSQQIEALLERPELLRETGLLLSREIMRALVEILSGAGVHAYTHPGDGRQRIILWNNHNSPDLTYRLAGQAFIAFNTEGRAGPLAHFAVLLEDQEGLELVQPSDSQDIADLEHWLAQFEHLPAFEQIKDLDIGLQLDLSGKKPRQAYIRIHNGRVTNPPQLDREADLIIEVSEEDWLALVKGETTAATLLKGGKIQAQGDYNLIPRLALLISQSTSTSRFRVMKWRLVVNYMQALNLEFGNI